MTEHQESGDNTDASASASRTGGRQNVAGALGTAAHRLHTKADSMNSDRLASVTDKTADALASTASFVRKFDTRDALTDVGSLVKKHPGKALTAVALIGFFLARAMTRNTSA